jgi:hypothetical protein
MRGPGLRPKRRETLIDRVMNEVTLYGGLPMRRGDILILAAEHLGPHANCRFGADYFAMMPPAVDMEPWTLDEARRICNGERSVRHASCEPA